MLGVQLPPPGEPLPEDVEYNIAQLSAAAAEKLLERNKAEAAAREALENLQDPIVQNETESLRIKGFEAETKRILALAKIEEVNSDRATEILLKIFEEMSETERVTLQAEVQKGADASEMQLRQAELASDLGQGMMGKVADLLIARLKSDGDKAKAAAKSKMN